MRGWQVTAVGSDVDAMAVGDRVVGLARLPFGGLAEHCLGKASDLLPIPVDLDDVSAAAMHTAFQTAWFALHHRAALHAGETLLVHAVRAVSGQLPSSSASQRERG